MVDSFIGTTAPDIDHNSGAFIWTPTEADFGTHNVNVHASDSTGHNAYANFQLFVVDTLPTVTPVPTPVVSTLPTPAPVTTMAPATPTAETFTLSLSSGANGPQVTALQILLKKEGFFSSTANGHFGPETKAAVVRFQKAYGISAVGTVGLATRNVLNELTSRNELVSKLTPIKTANASIFTTSLKVGSSGAEVTALQQQLTADHVYTGPINGKFGSLTKAAVIEFQSRHGLEKIGSIGPATRALLNQGK
jgi:peptidoglycan hydrolase-like protein with peptidoglycan-binding domain